MSAVIVDGKELAREIQASLALQAAEIALKLGRKPCLAVVLVGENPSSKIYVSAKTKAAHNIGMETVDCLLPEAISQEKLEQELKTLCRRDDVDGVLLQLPLPRPLSEEGAILAIDPLCDVDGLHPVNQGLLMRGSQATRPCTPLGVLSLIDKARSLLALPADLKGLQAIVVGRSVLVGKPVALMLLERHCTVTICHSRTQDLAAQCRCADILIAAVGKERLIRGDWVKPSAIVIDVGINRTEEGKIVGDVDFESVKEVAAALSPVPGGVGPMTITMLLANTLRAAQQRTEA